MMSFLIVKTPKAYNAIYGRPLLNIDGTVPSTYHQIIKFPTSKKVRCVRRDQQTSRRCYVDDIQVKGLPPVMMLDVGLQVARRRAFEAKKIIG